jgi:hypothetical protein
LPSAFEEYDPLALKIKTGFLFCGQNNRDTTSSGTFPILGNKDGMSG